MGGGNKRGKKALSLFLFWVVHVEQDINGHELAYVCRCVHVSI